MHKRTAEEDGWILVTAISLMAIMLVVALASMTLVDTQQKRSREQRERESSLNLAEGALFAQGFQLARRWPGTPATAVAQDCLSSTAAVMCPTAAQVQQNADNVDTRGQTTWTTLVRDNGGALRKEFQPSLINAAQTDVNVVSGATYTCPAPCRWDANGDRKLWVQSSAIVRRRSRNVVATLKLEKITEATPRAAVTAGGINVANSGNQVKIYAQGSSVVVRCNPAQSTCVTNQLGIQPQAVQGNPPNLMTPMQIERLRLRAEADGTYYNGCAAIKRVNNKLDLSGAVVFVDGCSTADSFATYPCTQPLPPKPAGAGNGLAPDCINSELNPGLLIWHCGKLEFTGNGTGTYIGVMYFVNGSDSPTAPSSCAGVAPIGGSEPNCGGNNLSANNVFVSSGGFGVWGALAIDGNGCLYASSNGMQVQYNPNGFNSIASYGAVGLVQDTWREVSAN